MSFNSQISLAWRNLWRNRRRSAVTILSLAFGFAAVALFAGYTSAVYSALSNAAIHAELIGHLTINRMGWQTEGKLHPEKYLLSAEDIAQVQRIVGQRVPGARLVPKLSAAGLLSNGHSSTIFVATGIAAEDLNLLRGPFRNAPGALLPDQPQGVTVGQGLADVLGMGPERRAREIIEKCAHPDYRPLLLDYLEQGLRSGSRHTPVTLSRAFEFHNRFLENGTMMY